VQTFLLFIKCSHSISPPLNVTLRPIQNHEFEVIFGLNLFTLFSCHDVQQAISLDFFITLSVCWQSRVVVVMVGYAVQEQRTCVGEEKRVIAILHFFMQVMIIEQKFFG